MDDLDELLAGRDGAERGHARRLLLDTFEELARQLEVDVGLEQHAPDLAQPFLDVRIGQDATPAEPRENGVEFLAQFIEHSL